MVTRLLVAVLVALTVSATDARSQLIQLFGEERVGSSGGQFLRVPVGAREIAMGGGMAATVTGASSLFWNPAAMSSVRRSGRLFVSHMEYTADININHVGYVRRMGSWQLGLSGGLLSSGEILRTTELHPNGAGFTFTANQFLLGLSLGRQLTDRFSFAATGKLLQENLDEFENRAFMVDLGALYYVGFRRARIGFAVRNFGGDLRLNGSAPSTGSLSSEWQSFPAPTVAVFGFAYDVGTAAAQRLTLSLDFSHPSDQAESLIVGGELGMWNALFLRGGYRSQVSEGGVSLGFGLRVLQRASTLRFGYAFDDRGNFGGIHVFSLEVGQ